MILHTTSETAIIFHQKMPLKLEIILKYWKLMFHSKNLLQCEWPNLAPFAISVVVCEGLFGTDQKLSISQYVNFFMYF